MIKLEITQEHQGLRITQCVSEFLPELQSLNLKKMIKAGDIKLNGCLIKKDFEVLNDSFPTIYRIDRIRELKILDEKFFIPYRNRFEEGEFRKRIQFMYGGKLRNVKFKYIGDDIDAILDRLPTAQILEEGKGYYIVKAEVFGKGIDMWLRSQGDKVEVMG